MAVATYSTFDGFYFLWVLISVLLVDIGTTEVSTWWSSRWQNTLNLKFGDVTSIQAHTVWNQQANACVVTGTAAFRWSILTNLIVDVTLLSIMFVGVMRKKNTTRLWRILYFQGIFWIMTAIATEVPCLVSHPFFFWRSYV